jgi:Methylamine utilisation protein MauE
VNTHIVHWFFRLFIGGILLASALGKSLDLPGFVDVLITYQAIPALLLWPTALLITGVEWLLGVWVLSGWRLVRGALLSLALYAGYAIWMTLSLVRGLNLANCGCYGRFFPQPLRWYSPLEDLILVGMCYALWKSARKVSVPH